MKTLYKIFNSFYTNMSTAFRTILYIGVGIFLLQQLSCGVLNIFYIANGYQTINLHNLANTLFSSSFGLLTFTLLISLLGDYVVGRGE